MQFEVKSGEIVITDPCYVLEDTSHCIGEVKAQNGIWDVTVIKKDFGVYGIRNAELLAVHEDADDHDHSNLMTNGRPIEKAICVDSGQAGFFDRQYFLDQGDDRDVGNFYNDCMDATLGEMGYGTIGNSGVVARSGFGDGAYECCVINNKDGEAVGLRLVFISFGDDDHDDVPAEDF